LGYPLVLALSLNSIFDPDLKETAPFYLQRAAHAFWAAMTTCVTSAVVCIYHHWSGVTKLQTHLRTPLSRPQWRRGQSHPVWQDRVHAWRKGGRHFGVWREEDADSAPTNLPWAYPRSPGPDLSMGAALSLPPDGDSGRKQQVAKPTGLPSETSFKHLLRPMQSSQKRGRSRPLLPERAGKGKPNSQLYF